MKIYICINCFSEIVTEDYVHFLECDYCNEKMILKKHVCCGYCESNICINCFKGECYEEFKEDN